MDKHVQRSLEPEQTILNLYWEKGIHIMDYLNFDFDPILHPKLVLECEDKDPELQGFYELVQLYDSHFFRVDFKHRRLLDHSVPYRMARYMKTSNRINTEGHEKSFYVEDESI